MLLDVQGVHTYYETSHILKGISFDCESGELVTILGRNGAGKSTTLKTIMGLAPAREGRILFKGKDIAAMRPHSICRLGISYVPETRDIFSLLSTMENLEIAARKGSKWTVKRVFDTFPALRELKDRRGAHLSGGEQQMLAIARALMPGPDLILLDEPSQGLAPLIVQTILGMLDELKKDGISILLVEQNFHWAAGLTDRVYVIDQGQMVYSGSLDELTSNDELMDKYLGVGV
jgi:branched-chain amino acid transport system ATP-binding protein